MLINKTGVAQWLKRAYIIRRGGAMNRKLLTKKQLLKVYKTNTAIAQAAGLAVSTVCRNWPMDEPIPHPWSLIFRNLINPEQLDKEHLSDYWRNRDVE